MGGSVGRPVHPWVWVMALQLLQSSPLHRTLLFRKACLSRRARPFPRSSLRGAVTQGHLCAWPKGGAGSLGLGCAFQRPWNCGQVWARGH